MSSSSQAGDRPAQMDTQASTSGTQARRTRGPNRCIALTNQRERIVVVCNGYGQPIGRSDRLLSSYMGVIVRDGHKTPLTYSDWRRMPADRKTDMLQAIQPIGQMPISIDHDQKSRSSQPCIHNVIDYTSINVTTSSPLSINRPPRHTTITNPKQRKIYHFQSRG